MENSSGIIAVSLTRSRDSCAHANGSCARLELDLSPAGHVVVAVCLGFIGTFGFVNNTLVLFLFCRHKPLRSPINCVLASISVSDLLVCVLGTPFSFAASARRRWLIGARGCVWYGFINSFLGIVSLISLATLSYERYCTMMGATQADTTSYRKVFIGITFSWSYSLVWTMPPLLGWSHYGPEGPGTTCSVNWTSKTTNNVSYIVCLFFFCLILPFVVIVYSYVQLLQAIKQVKRINTALGQKREHRVLLQVVTMVVCYLLCWLPYGIMALVSTFGEAGLVTPEASIIPSLLAKASTVINPIIYIFMNKQFFRCFRDLLICTSTDPRSNYKVSSKHTKCRCVIGAGAAPCRHPACSPEDKKQKFCSEPETGCRAAPESVKPRVSVVVYYSQ